MGARIPRLFKGALSIEKSYNEYKNRHIMKRVELIEHLEAVQENIETVERQVNRKEEDTPYYQLFGIRHRGFEHDKEIRVKALAYWKRRFNRIINELKY